MEALFEKQRLWWKISKLQRHYFESGIKQEINEPWHNYFLYFRLFTLALSLDKWMDKWMDNGFIYVT
jgi:hypothetical protein